MFRNLHEHHKHIQAVLVENKQQLEVKEEPTEKGVIFVKQNEKVAQAEESRANRIIQTLYQDN